MQTLLLDAAYVARLKSYFEGLHAGPDTSYSDYWKFHARQIQIEFDDEAVRIGGQSGYYVPKERRNLLYRTVRLSRRLYKSSVFKLDRLARLSTPHSPSTLIPADWAYDLLFEQAPCVDYEENPGRLDPTRLKPLFRSSRELRQNWFLSDRYYPTEHIYIAHYVYALLKAFLPSRKMTFLEIGAGNGNLASLFAHYDRMSGVIVDLPETILLSSSYIKSIFPEARILLPHEVSAERMTEWTKYDFVFLTPDQISLLPDTVFDFAVNIHSMQEMKHAQIEEYFALVQRTVKPGGIWANLNRVEKVLSKVDLPVRAFEFPYRKSNRVLVDEVDRYIRLISPDASLLHIEEVRP